MSTTSTDTTPFLWGQGGQRLTPEQIKSRRDIVNALMKSGTSYAPIQHWAQGLNRVAQALLGGYESGQLDRAEKTNTEENRQLLRTGLTRLYSGDETSPDTPASGSSPASLPAPGAAVGGSSPAPAAPIGGGAAPSAQPPLQPGQMPGSAPILPSDSFQKPAAAVGGAGGGDMASAIKSTAQRLGIDPIDLATVISYETGGKFSPSIMGGAGGRHMGLIQFGPSERQMYGASAGQSFGEQMGAVERYLSHRGLKPGMGLLDLYSTINAGRPGLYNASDARNGGAPGTVRDKVERQMGGHRARALALLGGGAALPASSPIQDDPSIPDSGPGVPLAYKAPPSMPGSVAGPAMSGMPQGDELKRMLAEGIIGAGDDVADRWRNEPIFRQAVDYWRQTPGGARGAAPTVAQNPAATPAADLPAQGASMADIPAQGAGPAGFFVPPAVSGGEPTILPSADDAAPGAQPVAQQVGRVKVAQALMSPPRRQSRADPGALADMLGSPVSSDQTQLVGKLILQKELEARKPETYTFQKVGDRYLRLGSKGSVADTGISDFEKPTFGVIGKDEFGREQHGWIDPRARSVTPYNAPRAAPSGPSAIPPVPEGVDPKAWRDAHSKAAAEGSATGNFDQEAKLRAEYNKNLGTFAEVHDAFGRVISSTQGRSTDPNAKSPAADISLVFGFMKMLDPGSVVREGEYATAKNAAGVPDRILNTYNKLLSGEFLSADQRQDFVNQAGRVYGQARKKAEETAGVYRTLSKGYGVNADRVVTMPEGLTAPIVNAPAPGSAAPRGAGAPAGQVARPTTEAEFNAIPSGAYYVDPDDNRTYRKP